MSARREKRLRMLERRVEELVRIAHPPTEDCHFGIVTPPISKEEYDKAMDAAWDVMNPKKGIIQRIKDFFRKEV